jgi:cysteinyl-tRNA synthetase
MLELAPPRVVRYYLGQAHYRSILDYRPTSLQEAAAAVERIDGFIAKAGAKLGGGRGQANLEEQPSTEWLQIFAAAMDDDLNVPQALAALHDAVRTGNTALASGEDLTAQAALHSVLVMTRVLGLDAVQMPEAAQGKEHSALTELVEAQLEARAEARANKDWAKSDSIRDTLKAAGVIVEDGPDGATWSLQRD